MTLERISDGAASDVAVKSTSGQHVPTPIGECSFSSFHLNIISIDILVLFYFVTKLVFDWFAVSDAVLFAIL